MFDLKTPNFDKYSLKNPNFDNFYTLKLKKIDLKNLRTKILTTFVLNNSKFCQIFTKKFKF